MAKRKKRAPEAGSDKRPDASVSFEDFKRREHDNALGDLRHAAMQLEIHERVAKSVLRRMVADGEIFDPQHARDADHGVLPTNLERLRKECGWTVDELA